MSPSDVATLMLQLHTTAQALGEAMALHHGKRAGKKAPEIDVKGLPAEVPAAVLEALEDMFALRAPLMTAMGTPVESDKATSEQLAIDLVLDAQWRGLRLWGQATVERLVESPVERAKVQRALDVVFARGLAFINGFGRPEWQESELRLEILDRGGFAKDIEAFGGADHLRLLRDAHVRYGKAFHLTTAPPSTVAEPRVAETMFAAADGIREYVASVVGTVRAKKPETGALAARLLAPMNDYGRSVAAPEKPELPQPSGGEGQPGAVKEGTAGPKPPTS